MNQVSIRTFARRKSLIVSRSVARRGEETTKPVVGVVTRVVPPVPTEEQMKRRDADGVRTEGTKKDEDGDAMDVEQISVQPPLEETTTSTMLGDIPSTNLHL